MTRCIFSLTLLILLNVNFAAAQLIVPVLSRTHVVLEGTVADNSIPISDSDLLEATDLQESTLNPLSSNADLNIAIPGATLQSHANVSATWKSAHSGQVVFEDLGWTSNCGIQFGSGSKGVLAEWEYNFVNADSPITINVDFSVSLHNEIPFAFAAHGFSIIPVAKDHLGNVTLLDGGLSIPQGTVGNWSKTFPTLDGNSFSYGVIVSGSGGDAGGLFKLHQASMSGTFDWNISATPVPTPVLVASRVYHNSFSGSGPKVDDSVVLMLRNSQAQTMQLSNIVNSSHGINGVALDFDNLAAPDDLTFEYTMSPQHVFATAIENWAIAPNPSSVTLLPDSGLAGSDRVLITWEDHAIEDRYLRIKVSSSGQTIAELYLGHLLGETSGLSGSVFTVSFADIAPIRTAVGSTVGSSSILDIDKNGIVAFADISAMRQNVGAQLTIVTIPATGS